LKKKLVFFIKVFLIYFFSLSFAFSNLQDNLINKLSSTKTLSFDFKQIIADKEETGNCFIKYPLLMKCNYKNLKQKTLISNGRTLAIIKKKYKKIYYYPLKSTPLFIILKKEKILNLIRNHKPSKIDANIIEYEFVDKKSGKLKLLFDKKSFLFKGWITKDAYSNNVVFIINNLKINNQIVDGFFKIPREEDL